tara:strand:- start:106 stop:333 length:228 start_codon:yes stop_codon:yes gene_type:complete
MIEKTIFIGITREILIHCSRTLRFGGVDQNSELSEVSHSHKACFCTMSSDSNLSLELDNQHFKENGIPKKQITEL